MNYSEREAAGVISWRLQPRRIHGEVVRGIRAVVDPGVQGVKLGSLAQMISGEY
jgi:hypothetical protein